MSGTVKICKKQTNDNRKLYLCSALRDSQVSNFKMGAFDHYFHGAFHYIITTPYKAHGAFITS